MVDVDDDSTEPPESETTTSEDKHTLLGLPRELAIRIVEDDCITIQDRMNLRRTCKRLESIVADSDYRPASQNATLNIEQEAQTDVWKTQVVGLLNAPIVFDSVTKRQAAAYSHLLTRLYRRVHFEEIVLDWVTFNENHSHGRMHAKQLLPKHIECNSLDIKVPLSDYDTRMFDVIAALNPAKQLALNFVWERFWTDRSSVPPHVVDGECLTKLPHVQLLRIEANRATVKMSGATILALLEKHQSLVLHIKHLVIDPETFVKAIKIVAKLDHRFDIRLRFPLLMQCLRLLGVVVNTEGILTTLDSSVEIERKAFPKFSNYGIKVNGANIFIDNVFHQGEIPCQTLRVLMTRDELETPMAFETDPDEGCIVS